MYLPRFLMSVRYASRQIAIFLFFNTTYVSYISYPAAQANPYKLLVVERLEILPDFRFSSLNKIQPLYSAGCSQSTYSYCLSTFWRRILNLSSILFRSHVNGFPLRFPAQNFVWTFCFSHSRDLFHSFLLGFITGHFMNNKNYEASYNANFCSHFTFAPSKNKGKY